VDTRLLSNGLVHGASPFEMLWSKLKAFLRKLKPRTRADLDVAVSTFIASLQQKDLLGYFLETEARAVFI
jgi:hypothetical protein